MTLTALPEQSSMPDGGLLPSSAIIGKVGIDQTTPGTTNAVQVLGSSSPSFVATASVIRPANATPYAATPQSINCKLTVTEVAYTGLVVTIKAAGHGFVAGDRFTLAGVNTGATLTNVDGNWVVTSADTDHIVFSVTSQPTGTTPQTGLTITSAIAKCMSVDVGGIVGGGVLMSRVSVSLPGVAMTQAVRLYIYDVQPTVLVDQATFTIFNANDTYRRTYIDLFPVTEGSGSDCNFATSETVRMLKCATADTRLYFRLCSEGVGTPTSAGVVTVKVSGIQLMG
ncbi:MAG: hypothetical protein M0R06_01195 [Sphaerochaeta sp.]|jgi:hypothetical protein|nr:hypothetical protein [Sphaerochaeta sp.]